MDPLRRRHPSSRSASGAPGGWDPAGWRRHGRVVGHLRLACAIGSAIVTLSGSGSVYGARYRNTRPQDRHTRARYGTVLRRVRPDVQDDASRRGPNTRSAQRSGCWGPAFPAALTLMAERERSWAEGWDRAVGREEWRELGTAVLAPALLVTHIYALPPLLVAAARSGAPGYPSPRGAGV